MANLGENDYRSGALERMENSRLLLADGQYAGSVYLAGRGVEGMMRALIWKRDEHIRSGRKALETGHNLAALLKRVGQLGLLKTEGRDANFRAHVQRVSRLWFNDMRFVATIYIERRWRAHGELSRKRTMKMAAGDFYNDCQAIVKRCESLCQH